MDENGYSGRLRKRKRTLGDGSEESLKSLLDLVENCGKIVIFSGSGLSANSGMSMFTTKNGLYERARHKFKIQDGMKLFSYPFYKQRRKDLQAFFAQIYSEAQSSRAAPGHVAIAELHKIGRLQRHYTLNIDGLAGAVGMDTWHHESNPEGSTVEMHGNISYVVCPSCHAVEPLTGVVMQTMKACEPVLCKACHEDEMRFKVMLYDDEQGDCITPEDVFERLDDDLAVAGAVIWVGISFEQSASTEYFRKVRHMLASHGRLHEVPQVILNPSDEPYFNVISTMSNKEDIKVLDVRATSDDALPCIVQHLHQLEGTTPDKAAMQAAAEAAAAAAAAAKLKHSVEQQQQPADDTDENCTVILSQGRGKRKSSSAANSLGDPAANQGLAAQGSSGASVTYAELVSMDNAAAAALSLPAAVHKHLLQQQLRQELGSHAKAVQDTQRCTQPQAVSDVSATQLQHAVDPPSSQPIASVGAHSNLQALLGQVYAVQAALATATQQQQQSNVAACAGLTEGQQQLLACLAMPQLQGQAGVQQLPHINPLQSAALASLAAVQSCVKAQPACSESTQAGALAVNGGDSLAAAQQLLPNCSSAASLLLSNPALLAALAAANSSEGSGRCAPAVLTTSASGNGVHEGPSAAAGSEPTASQGCKQEQTVLAVQHSSDEELKSLQQCQELQPEQLQDPSNECTPQQQPEEAGPACRHSRIQPGMPEG